MSFMSPTLRRLQEAQEREERENQKQSSFTPPKKDLPVPAPATPPVSPSPPVPIKPTDKPAVPSKPSPTCKPVIPNKPQGTPKPLQKPSSVMSSSSPTVVTSNTNIDLSEEKLGAKVSSSADNKLKSPRTSKSHASKSSAGKGKRKISLPSLSRRSKSKQVPIDFQITHNGAKPAAVSSPSLDVPVSSPSPTQERRNTAPAATIPKQSNPPNELDSDTVSPKEQPSSISNNSESIQVLQSSTDGVKTQVLSKDPRENVVRELYETEVAYLEDLEIIVGLYLNPLRESNLVSEGDLTKLFSTVEMLLPLHQDLKEQLSKSPSVVNLLDKSQKGDPNFSVGKSFMMMSQYLKMYSQYCSNQDTSTQTFTQLSKNRAFEEFVYEIKCQPKAKQLDLPSYLIKPMQRVCKYPLLLRELIKQTPPSHADYEHLQTALEMISKTVSVINESKKVAEESETLFSIQQRITYPKKFNPSDHPIIAPGRKFLEKGSCTYVSRAFKSSTIKWYLFNDVLVITNARNQLKKYVPTNSALLGHVSIDGYEHAFEIIHCGTDKIWLAPKQMADQTYLREIFEKQGMIDRSSEAPVYSKLHEYASRPMPIPPGKFQQSFDGKNMNEIMDVVKSLSNQPPAGTQSIESPVKKRKSKFVISTPTQFRKGF